MESLNARVAGIFSILLSWEELDCPKSHGVVTGYLIRQDLANHSLLQPLSGNLKVSRLSPFHEYSFEIAAINDAGIGRFTETKGSV